jgi:hypothetical protein
VVDGEGVTRQGFVAGAPVLSPTEAWEMAGVYDPAILVLPSGAVRLYYATAQGLGIAEAPSIAGSFVRLVTSPLFGDVAGHGPAQSPAPTMLPNGDVMLYVEADGLLFAARSSDGLAFTLIDGDASTGAIDPLSLPVPVVAIDAGVPSDAGAMDASVATEISQRAPTAVTAQSVTGRTLVRLYFESRRTDGTSVLAIAGSFDGEVFERSAVVPYTKNNPAHPAVWLREDGITLLTFAVVRQGGGLATALPLLGIAPAALPLPTP